MRLGFTEMIREMRGGFSGLQAEITGLQAEITDQREQI